MESGGVTRRDSGFLRRNVHRVIPTDDDQGYMRMKNRAGQTTAAEKQFVVVCESAWEVPIFVRKDWWCSSFGVCSIDKEPPTDFRYSQSEAEHYAAHIREFFPNWTVQVLEVGSIDRQAMQRRL